MFAIVYITASSEDEAKNIARVLVDKKLAACCNIMGAHSIYRWKGEVKEANEWVVVAKTKKALFDKIVDAVKDIHSCDTPCIVMVDITAGYKKFLDWIDDSCMA